MRIHYLQHVPFEGPATIADWSGQKGHPLTGTQLYNGESLPAMGQFDWLIIMGGPMNIYEETAYPWLATEKEFIKEAIDCGKVVLGICLGAQLITDALGGEVTKNPEGEIGWLPISLTAAAFQSPLFQNFPDNLWVFQWHNDTFSTLGEGSIGIATSEACGEQAFIYQEKVIGFQFHLESSPASIQELLANCGDDLLVGGSYVQSKAEILAGMNHLTRANGLMVDFFDKLEEHFSKE